MQNLTRRCGGGRALVVAVGVGYDSAQVSASREISAPGAAGSGLGTPGKDLLHL